MANFANESSKFLIECLKYEAFGAHVKSTDDTGKAQLCCRVIAWSKVYKNSKKLMLANKSS